MSFFPSLFLKNEPFPVSFSLFSSFQYIVDSKQMFNINFFCQSLNSNCGPLVLDATTLPTEPHNHCPSFLLLLSRLSLLSQTLPTENTFNLNELDVKLSVFSLLDYVDIPALPTYLPIYLPTYLSTYLPIYLPTYLPTYLCTLSYKTYTYVKLEQWWWWQKRNGLPRARPMKTNWNSWSSFLPFQRVRRFRRISETNVAI